jgi:hypothetical protein
LRVQPGVEAHHEFGCTHIQPVAAKYYMRLAAREEVIRAITRLHGSASYWSDAPLWIDASNKLTWIVDCLIEVFPEARFVNLIRDGRKVALSYYKKLPDEMYDDASVAILREWIGNQDLPEPPPEKRYWWNIPQPGQPFDTKFEEFNQFERAAYHWTEANRVARHSLSLHVPKSQQLTMRLEDLVSTSEDQRRLCEFLGIEHSETFEQVLSRPENVIIPIDYSMNQEQRRAFEAIAGDEMSALGYRLDEPEYRVEY